MKLALLLKILYIIYIHGDTIKVIINLTRLIVCETNNFKPEKTFKIFYPTFATSGNFHDPKVLCKHNTS